MEQINDLSIIFSRRFVKWNGSVMHLMDTHIECFEWFQRTSESK